MIIFFHDSRYVNDQSDDLITLEHLHSSLTQAISSLNVSKQILHFEMRILLLKESGFQNNLFLVWQTCPEHYDSPAGDGQCTASTVFRGPAGTFSLEGKFVYLD